MSSFALLGQRRPVRHVSSEHLRLPKRCSGRSCVYVFLVILLRVFGKRELAQLNPFDLVVLLSLANTVQNAIIGDDTSLTGGTDRRVRAVCGQLYGRPLPVQAPPSRPVDRRHAHRLDRPTGSFAPKGMAKEMLTEIELLTMAHRQGFASLEEVESCVLEPGGTFFIQGKTPRLSERYHAELLAKLDHLGREIEHLRRHLEDMGEAGSRSKRCEPFTSRRISCSSRGQIGGQRALRREWSGR